MDNCRGFGDDRGPFLYFRFFAASLLRMTFFCFSTFRQAGLPCPANNLRPSFSSASPALAAEESNAERCGLAAVSGSKISRVLWGTGPCWGFRSFVGPRAFTSPQAPVREKIIARLPRPSLIHDAPIGGATLSRLGKVRKRSLLSAYAKLHAANGETVRTAVDALGVHEGTAEVQVRPVHARRRVRRTAPGVTARAYTAQAAGIAGAETRSGRSNTYCRTWIATCRT